jgi:hypothetical protein
METQNFQIKKGVNMIMKTIYLKIGIVLVLALIATVAIKVFWPSETAPVVQPEDTEQVQKEVKVGPVVEPKMQQPVVKPVSEPPRPRGPQIPEEERLYPEAEKLYQMASRHRQPVSSPAVSYNILVSCCQQIFNQYPNSTQVEKARKLLQEAKETYPTQFATALRSVFPSKPAVKKSRPLRKGIKRLSLHPSLLEIPDVNMSSSEIN